MLRHQWIRFFASRDHLRIANGVNAFAVASGRAVCRQCHVVHSPLPPVETPKGNFVDFVLHYSRTTPRLHEKTAIINGATDERFAYKDLFAATAAVASSLYRLGIRKGQVVCLFAENSPEFIFALYGTISSGGAVTCASSSFTESELEYQLRDSKSEILITTQKLVEIAKKAAAAYGKINQIIVIGGTGSDSTLPFDALLNDNGGANPSEDIDLNENSDMAVLPYSSGTTGLPKGVMLSHANISVNLRQIEPILPCYSTDTTLGVLPFTHIYGMIPIIGATLRAGATIVTHPSFQPNLFIEAITEHKVSIIHLVPPIILFMKDHPMAKECDKSSIRLIVSAAAPLAAETQMEFYEYMKKSNPFIQVVQAYGLSETSPGMMGCPPGWMKPGSVGVPMPSQAIKIVDVETERSLGPMERGEILLSGPNVMRGYLGNQEATDSTIRDGWLYTGDIGYYDHEGFFFVVDRMKELIKYKGLQVAPAELEGLLLTHPAVIDAAVVARTDPRTGEVPAAFVVLDSTCSSPPSPEDVASFIAERVADHKELRGGVFFADKIPKSPSGKILRRVLRDHLNKL